MRKEIYFTSSINTILQKVNKEKKDIEITIETSDLPWELDDVDTPANINEVSGIIIDTLAKTVTFNYLLSSTYKAVGSNVKHMTYVNGKTEAIALPNLNSLLPEVEITHSASATKNGKKIKFTLKATIEYNASVPVIYNVVVGQE